MTEDQMIEFLATAKLWCGVHHSHEGGLAYWDGEYTGQSVEFDAIGDEWCGVDIEWRCGAIRQRPPSRAKMPNKSDAYYSVIVRSMDLTLERRFRSLESASEFAQHWVTHLAAFQREIEDIAP